MATQYGDLLPNFVPQSAARPIKKFFGNISLVILLNLLVKPGWVVVENLVQDRLGHAAFGTFTALFNLTIIFAALSDLGLTQHTTKRVAATPDFLPEYFPTVLPLKTGLSLVFLGVVTAVGWGIGYRGHTLTLLALIGAGMLLTQYIGFLRGALQGYQRFNTDAVLSVVEKALLLALVLLLLPVGLTLDRYVGARSVATLVTFLLLYGLVTRLYGWVRYRPRWEHVRLVVRESLPFALIMLLYGLNERVDMIMLERLVSPQEAGYYAGAYRWMDAVMMYLWTVLPLFFAKFAHATHRRDELRELLWFGQRIVTVPLLFVSAFVLFRGEVLFWQFSHSTAAELTRMTLSLKVLFLNVVVHAFFAIYSTLLTSTNQEKAVSWLIVASITLNIVLNVLLLPRYGALAAASNTLICTLLVSGGYVWLVRNRAQVAIPWAVLGRLAVAFGLLCAVFFGLRRLVDQWLLETVGAGIAFVVILFATRVVRLAELKALIRR
ncbi:oligosaccharide flippase family protein [Hymenobacter sp. BT491]|uniref:oligosaccharide flippase family protein n=1 Tax=Hymenobacter sp. BT491 TaxID=2766779 RepID=UPI0016539405|nr:oligosaccharide flippase family protein [Hymenobacter sp. BT491]MBC6988903.1 oligosaccharide flippase family protein [Hymenobacter sp. BT491]